MAVQLPTDLATASQNPYPSDPLLWAWEIQVDVNEGPAPSTVLRVVAADSEITIGGATYYPYPIAQSPIQSNADGDLPSLTLSFDNAGRWLMPYLDQADGFIGNRATSRLVNANNPLTHPEATLAWQIASAEADAQQVSFRLELPSPFLRRVPTDRYNPQLCRWVFGGRECGYPINEAAAFTTCNKTIPECIARGDDEDARRIPRLHPKRFGGFRGVPTERAP